MPTISQSPPRPLALTMGDPAGIGPDIILMAWQRRHKDQLPPFVVLGCPALFASRAEALGIPVPVERISSPTETHETFTSALPIYPLPLEKTVNPGRPDPASAAQTINAIDKAVEWTLNGAASAIVTAPINKSVLTQAGFSHPGHTEYLAELCTQDGSRPLRPVMLIAAPALRVVPVTVHIPLADVPKSLSQDLIVETVTITHQAMQDHFSIKNPRIGMTGLNPHAGDSGLLGAEEIEIIVPAIQQLKSNGITVNGPLPADAAFQKRSRSQYDVIVAMYHDQALIPVKTLAFDEAVNVTLGLPIIRTSPDHGTAYDLAGTGKAIPDSFLASIRLANQLTTSRQLAVS